MTTSKHPKITIYTSHVEFDEPLAIYSTDKVELDYKYGIVAVVNSAGKVKERTRFREIRHGSSTTTGSGQDTRVVGEGSSQEDTVELRA